MLLSILLPWRKTNRWETRAKKTDKLNPWWCYSLWFTICLQLIIWCSDVRSLKGMMNSFPIFGTESNLTFFFPPHFLQYSETWFILKPFQIFQSRYKHYLLHPLPYVEQKDLWNQSHTAPTFIISGKNLDEIPNIGLWDWHSLSLLNCIIRSWDLIISCPFFLLLG